VPELNLDGVSGYVCPIGDVEMMAERSLHILADENLAGFKKRALERALQFDIKNILPMYVNYYIDVLEKFRKKLTVEV
jgi:glycosyltransferase involved in cell wall biosynthesis